MALVVGVGNPDCGDDGAGPAVAASVSALDLPGVEVVTASQPLALVELMADHDDVVVVDALAGHDNSGRVHVWQVGDRPLQLSTQTIGSHGLGVEHAIELARALDLIPRRLTIVGVEGVTFNVGSAMSTSVREHLDDAVRAVKDALG